MKDWRSQAHVSWKCKYHVVIVPKYSQRRLFGSCREKVGEFLRQLCRQKEIELLEGHVMPDHLHMLLSVPPKCSIAMTVGHLKGKSAVTSAPFLKHHSQTHSHVSQSRSSSRDRVRGGRRCRRAKCRDAFGWIRRAVRNCSRESRCDRCFLERGHLHQG